MRKGLYALIVSIIVFIAVGFPAYIASGQGLGNQATVTVTAKPRLVTPPPGGGGGGGAPAEEECPVGEVYAGKWSTTEGVFLRMLIVESFDGKLRLIVDKGTLALTRHGRRLGCIGIHHAEEIPPLPEDAYLISAMYDAVPDGASFSPPAILRYYYEPDTLPAEVAEEKLVLASFDKERTKWTPLYCAVDTQSHTVTAEVSHFTDLAVFGYGVEAPLPAFFEVSSLNIFPGVVNAGEVVNISVLVTNSGGQAASYLVVLKINGLVERVSEVVLEPGASTEVSFSVVRVEPGIYSVDVNGTSGQFEVRPLLPPRKPFNWWIIALAAAGAALAALLSHALVTQKKHGGVSGALAVDVKEIASFFAKVKLIPSRFGKARKKRK